MKSSVVVSKLAGKKKLLLVALSLVLVFTMFGTMALAATDAEKITIRENDVLYGDKGDLTKLKMNSSKDLKQIWLEGDAVKAAVSKKKTFGFLMGDLTLSFSPNAFYTADLKQAMASGEPWEIKLEVDADSLLDVATYFDSMTQNPKGNYNFTSYGFEIKAEIYVAGRSTYTINKFAEPLKMTFDYEPSWNRNPLDMPERTLTMGWLDKDKVASSGKEWNRLTTKVNTSEKTITCLAPYAYGFYLPIGVSGADNTKTGSLDTGSTTGGNESTKPAGGIPDGHWATADILLMQQAQVVPNDLSNIRVDQPITRGQFAAYIVNALKLEENTSLAGKFSDVNSNTANYKQILTGAYHGIISGTSANKFQPNANITRQEMAVFFNRALVKKAVAVDTDKSKLGAMSDAGTIAAWAKESCAVAVNAGLITGKENNKFAPTANATWAEAVVMLNRLYNKVK